MPNLAALFFIAFLVTFGGPVSAGEVKRQQNFASEALSGPMRYSIYLPDAYRADPQAGFPVVYLLHGYGANENEWLDFGNADWSLDRMITDGKIPPFIAVMPYAAKSWYVDSAAQGGPGDYETAIIRDLPAHIEQTYRIMPGRAGRYIAGLSMGGYGAMRFAFFHPGRYQAAASLSGALFEDTGIPSFEGPIDSSDAAFQEQAAYWFQGAYGQPFDAAVFRRLNPFSHIGLLAQSAAVPEILIMSGNDDFFDFDKGSMALHTALKRADIDAELTIEPGGHDWSLWRAQFPHVMRFFAGALKKAGAGNGH